MKKTTLTIILVILVTFMISAISCQKAEEVKNKPVLTTTAVENITATTATCGGSISDDGGAQITVRGLVYNTSQNPTLESNTGHTSEGNGTGNYNSNISGLTANTTYYICAYATNSVGTQYGNQQTFKTSDGVVTFTTAAVSGITATTAICQGSITTDGGDAIIARGAVWSTSQNPTVETNMGKTNNGSGTGTYTSNMTGLTANTTYYLRAYATNSVATSYDTERSFKTLDGVAVLTTAEVTSKFATTAICGGEITSDGGDAITSRGVVWSTFQDGTVISSMGITTEGSGTGTFVSSMTSLTQNTVYYVRAYATNSFGTQYGDLKKFTTPLPDGPGTSVTDADGNVYNTVWIGGLQWMKENLRVTSYNDDSDIPLVTDNSTWASLNTPAYCWPYNDKTKYANTYGALYNWYVVNTGKLCPSDWRVPSSDEWLALINYVGGETVAGTKLKATSGWEFDDNGTDNYGFSALPAGYRENWEGLFSNIGSDGLWWTSTITWNDNYAWIWTTKYGHGDMYRLDESLRKGFPVRCVRSN